MPSTPEPPAGPIAPGPIAPGIGERIRHSRLASGMTQADLATAVGVSRSAVAQWETDRAGQVQANLVRVAEALGVSVGHLLVGPIGPALPEASSANAAELALLRLYRACSAADRQLVMQTAIRLSRAKPG